MQGIDNQDKAHGNIAFHHPILVKNKYFWQFAKKKQRW